MPNHHKKGKSDDVEEKKVFEDADNHTEHPLRILKGKYLYVPQVSQEQALYLMACNSLRDDRHPSCFICGDDKNLNILNMEGAPRDFLGRSKDKTILCDFCFKTQESMSIQK
jgi:hypothetical protein